MLLVRRYLYLYSSFAIGQPMARRPSPLLVSWQSKLRTLSNGWRRRNRPGPAGKREHGHWRENWTMLRTACAGQRTCWPKAPSDLHRKPRPWSQLQQAEKPPQTALLTWRLISAE